MKLKMLTSIALISLCFVFFSNQITAQSFPKNPPTLKVGDPLPANLFVELAKAVNPAVVNISTSAKPRNRYYRDPMIEMLEQFYGRRLQPDQPSGKPRRMGLGTGFIIREDGLIVTNNHVIDGADLIEVQLSENDTKQYPAEVVGRDERTDIALIKIKPDTKLTVAVMGSSEETQVGEWVAAFGNPFGHGHSMSKGIISSKGREIEEINRLPLLQTDASINPGNSGGPLVNSKGLVIGVNSAIDARAQGIGFAIPIDEVKKLIPQLEQRGSIRKGYLGIGLGDIDDQAAEQLGLDEFRGAVVVEVGNGPGKKAGLKPYDIITEFNGKKIKYSRDLIDAVAGTDPNTTVTLKVLRDNKTLTLKATVSERPDEKLLSKSTSNNFQAPPSGQKAPHSLGAELADSTKELQEQFGISSEVKNPVVVGIERNSLASRVGLRVGDVLLSINGKEPKSAKEAMGLFKKGTNSVRVARGRGMSAMTFDIP